MNGQKLEPLRGEFGRSPYAALHLAIVLMLLGLAAYMDITKPLGKSWTILYLLPVLYAGWKIRGPIEIGIYITVIATTFVVPMVFRPQLLWGGTGFFNRTLGALIGILIIFLVRERRRYVNALEKANEELEERVAARVRELQVANEKLADDIQQREQAEQQLRESEARFRTFVDHATDAFFLHDDQGIVRDVNQQACDSLGYGREELMGMSPVQFDPELTAEKAEQITQQLNAGETVHFDSTHRRQDGSMFPVEVRIRPFVLHDECFRVSLVHDISERKLAEQQLRESEQRFRQLSDSAFEGLMIHESGVVRDANQAFANLFGLAGVQELIGRRALDVVPLTDESKQKIECQLRSPGEGAFEITAERPDGTIRVLETQGRDTIYQGRAARVVAMRDVTDRKLAEEERRRLHEQVQQAQRLESLGVMAGGVAHDFNNLLTVINGNSHLLRTNLEHNDPRHGFAAAIHAAGAQAAKLTRQLLMFSRGMPQQPEAVNLNEIIRQSMEMWRQVVGQKIEFECNCDENLWQVVVDRSQIEQVLLNLILNARDAMPDGGHISLQTVNREVAHLQTGKFVQVLVHDTGAGMSESVRARIFEPFFTTKNVGQGTGLGLPMCHGIVQQSGGWIDVNSEPGRGSTFSVMLPSNREITAAAAQQMAEGTVTAGSP
jgi:two-component system cell cycle sensor histidine kinase/response regulator CckA